MKYAEIINTTQELHNCANGSERKKGAASDTQKIRAKCVEVLGFL